MTQREFFEQVIFTVSDKEVVDFAQAQLIALDKKNARAKEKRMEVAKANEPILNDIMKYLGEHKSALASELASALQVSTPKAIAMCNKLIESDKVKVQKVKIAKVGERNSYSLM